MAIFPYFNHVKCAGNNELLMLSLLSLRGIFRAAAYLLDHKALKGQWGPSVQSTQRFLDLRDMFSSPSYDGSKGQYLQL